MTKEELLKAFGSKDVVKYDLKMNMIEEFDNIKNAKINSIVIKFDNTTTASII